MVTMESYKKYEINWNGVYEAVHETGIPKKSNKISSHVAYMIKVIEVNSIDLKAIIYPHGNRDKDEDSVRKEIVVI